MNQSGIGFEDAVTYRKKQGFNSVSMIACFPNWEADENANTMPTQMGYFYGRLGEIRLFRKRRQLTSKDMRTKAEQTFRDVSTA